MDAWKSLWNGLRAGRKSPSNSHPFLQALKTGAGINLVEQPNVFVCNFCGEVFATEDGPHPEFQSCTRCGTVARERMTYYVMLEELRAQGLAVGQITQGNSDLKRLRVLEFSPRPNATRRRLYKETFAEYVASDFDLKGHAADIKIDLCSEEDIRPVEGRFDIVIFSHVLEHIPDFRLALSNLARLLTPTGRVILQVPVVEAQRVDVTWDEFHGDKTRVFHRFGFDLAEECRAFFDCRTVVGRKDFTITSPEIDQHKYAQLQAGRIGTVNEIGPADMQMYGLGCPDLCDAFVLAAKGSQSTWHSANTTSVSH